MANETLPPNPVGAQGSSAPVILMPGGTGMLAGAARTWVLTGHTVVLISRSRERYEHLAAAVGPAQTRLHWVPGDYRDPVGWPDAVARACRLGSPDIVLAWVADVAALEVLADVVGQHRREMWRLFHVRGSRAAHQPVRLRLPPSCAYRLVILGFMWDGQHARWLTHDEIADGAVKAVAADGERCIIGTIEPWDRRPIY
jgi:hypothetical protein